MSNTRTQSLRMNLDRINDMRELEMEREESDQMIETSLQLSAEARADHS